MSEPMYTIKPLEWKKWSECHYDAETPIGKYTINVGRHYILREPDSICCAGHDSLPSAQSAAFAHYTARMREGLEEMKPPHIGYAGESFPIVPSMMKPASDAGRKGGG